MLLSLYVINKAGGLIYQRDYTEGRLSKLTSNEYLVLAGTFHGQVSGGDVQTNGPGIIILTLLKLDRVHAIASKISPVPNSSGIELLVGDTFKATCFQTLTGIAFPYFMQHATYF